MTQEVSIEGALRQLNQLKSQRIVKDYVVIGAVAFSIHVEPMYTADMDVVVLVDTYSEYVRAYEGLQAVSSNARGEYLTVAGVEVHLLTSETSPLFQDAITGAKQVRVGNIRTRVATVEHLILLALRANRPKDQIKAVVLLERADHARVQSLLTRFDDEVGTLAKRLEGVGGILG